jgi:hypothetical protein
MSRELGLIPAGKFSDSHSAYGEKVAANKNPKVMLRRMIFNTAEASATRTAYTNLIFTLSQPITNVVYVDWALIYDLDHPCLLNITEIPSNGVTSKGVPYFAALIGGSTQNLLVTHHKEKEYAQPININQLSMSITNLKSTDSVQNNDWSIELYFYTLE